MSEKCCSVDECTRPLEARGLCNAHYMRFLRTGMLRPEIPIGETQKRICNVNGCLQNAHDSNGHCNTHRYRAKVGLPMVAVPHRKRAKNGSDEISYSGAHNRVRKERGKASDYNCACGNIAQHWAYDGSDKNQKYGRCRPGAQTWAFYSLDPWKYAPMCHKCHNAKDASDRASELREYREWKHRTGMSLSSLEGTRVTLRMPEGDKLTLTPIDDPNIEEGAVFTVLVNGSHE